MQNTTQSHPRRGREIELFILILELLIHESPYET